MTSDDRITKLERDLRYTRLGMLLVVVAGAVAIAWVRPRQPDELVFGDVRIHRSGVTIQASEAPDVRVELTASGLALRGPHFTSTLQSSNLTFDGEHGTTAVSPGELAIRDSFGLSILAGSHWQAGGGDAKRPGATFGLNVTDTGATLAIGPRGAEILIDTGAKSTTLSGRNGVGSWMLVAGAAPRIYVTAGATTAALAPSSKP
jgi:hypothetical protein